MFIIIMALTFQFFPRVAIFSYEMKFYNFTASEIHNFLNGQLYNVLVYLKVWLSFKICQNLFCWLISMCKCGLNIVSD